MKQYWLFILTALQDIVFCTIDNAFANNISLDTIVVLNSFTIVMYFCLRPLLMGFWAYQAMQTNPKNCLICSLLSSILVGIILIATARVLPNVFTLTDEQKQMLSDIFMLFGFCAPIQAVARYLQEYCIYTGRQKLVLISAFITYIPMIIGDWIAVQCNAGTFGLRIATELCWLLYLIILLPASGILKVNDTLNWKTIRHCFYVGKDSCISQSIVRAATLFLTSMASTMGTEIYAIHSVALGITDMAESFREATQSYSIIELRDHRNDLVKQSLTVHKKLFVPALLLPLGLEIALVLITHGKVSIIDAAIATCLYSLPFLVYPMYDISAAAVVLSSVRSSAITMSIITAGWRVCILWILIQIFGTTIPVFSTVYFCDYLSRTIFYRIMLHRERKRKEILTCRKNP